MVGFNEGGASMVFEIELITRTELSWKNFAVLRTRTKG